MAIFTADLGMRARQREVGTGMVKGCVFPAFRGMTARAVCAERSIMFIVLLMAGITVCRCAFEDVVDVALLTLDFGMSAFEFESREVVIELRGLPAVG